MPDIRELAARLERGLQETRDAPPARRSPRCRKIRYTSEAEADRALGALLDQLINGTRRPKLECRAYACARCDGWHLTSKAVFHVERKVEVDSETETAVGFPHAGGERRAKGVGG